MIREDGRRARHALVWNVNTAREGSRHVLAALSNLILSATRRIQEVRASIHRYWTIFVIV